MINTNPFKTNSQESFSFSNYHKQFIIKIPNSSKKSIKSSLIKNHPFTYKNSSLEQTKRTINLKNLNTTRCLQSTSNSSFNNLLDNKIFSANKFFSPRGISLNRLKKFRYRKQTIDTEVYDFEQEGNFINRSQYCKIRIALKNNSRKQKQNISSKPQILQFKLKISTTTNLIENLKSKLKNKNIIGFECQSSNIKLDLFLTFDHCDISYLNGTSLHFLPLIKLNCPKVDISCFEIYKCIGSGGFSKVFLSRFKEDSNFYAIKMIDKKFIFKHKKTKIIMNERNIMESIDHPFVLKMKFAFQTANYIAFALQYCPGNQMFSLIKKQKRLTQQMARFYMIQILLGLEYLHKQGIIYRDFKPQNILIDLTGHIKIADFGLAKPNYFSQKDRAYSFCGSPQYMPPQMILKQGHSLSVDFYCLGAVLYEFVTGLPPFYSKDTNQIYQCTVNEQITFPQKLKISAELKHLLKGLLCKDQKCRLGSLIGARQVLAHPWFGKFDRLAYLNKQMKPPTNFKSINNIHIEPEQLKGKNESYVTQVKKQQNLEKNLFESVLKNFYYDYRFRRYDINEQFNMKRKSSETDFHKKIINDDQNKQKIQRKSSRLLMKRKREEAPINTEIFKRKSDRFPTQSTQSQNQTNN